MRILALVPGGISDQILFFPTLADLKQFYPQAEITVVADPQATAAYRVCQWVDQVIPFDFEDQNGLADWGNLLGQLRDCYADAAFTLRQGWGIGFLLWLTGIHIRIGYATNDSSQFFLTNRVRLKTEQYAAHMYHDLLQGLGISTPCPELSVNVPKKDIEWAEAEQHHLEMTDRGYILICGGSGQLIQMEQADQAYPVEHWQRIVQDFQERQPETPILLVQDPEDEEFVPALLRACPGVKVISPENIGQLAAIIAGANLVLCADSAPMHLAVAMQTYTIALFGSTDPEKALPASDKFIGIQSPTDQIADISPDMVLQKVWGG